MVLNIKIMHIVSTLDYLIYLFLLFYIFKYTQGKPCPPFKHTSLQDLQHSHRAQSLTGVSYNWQELPQVSFLSQQSFVTTDMCLWWQNTYFVMRKVCLSQQNLCLSPQNSFLVTRPLTQQIFVATNICHNKIKFVTTNILLSQQKTYFVMTNTCLSQTNTCLSWQNFCHDKNDTCGSSCQW